MTRTGGEGHPYRHTVTVDLRGGVTHLPGPGWKTLAFQWNLSLLELKSIESWHWKESSEKNWQRTGALCRVLFSWTYGFRKRIIVSVRWWDADIFGEFFDSSSKNRNYVLMGCIDPKFVNCKWGSTQWSTDWGPPRLSWGSRDRASPSWSHTNVGICREKLRVSLNKKKL